MPIFTEGQERKRGRSRLLLWALAVSPLLIPLLLAVPIFHGVDFNFDWGDGWVNVAASRHWDGSFQSIRPGFSHWGDGRAGGIDIWFFHLGRLLYRVRWTH